MAIVVDSEPQSTETVEFISKGQITIPKRLRDDYHIEPGQKGTLIPIPGAMILVPQQARTPDLFDEIRTGLGTEDMSLEDMIAEMRGIRESSNYEA